MVTLAECIIETPSTVVNLALLLLITACGAEVTITDINIAL